MQHDSRNTDAVVRTRPPTRALALSAALLLAAAGGQTSWASQVAGDFDGDGRDDLAIGVPFEGLGAPDFPAEVGVVNVVYGGAGGLAPAGNQLWHQDVAGVEGTVAQDDEFGTALAAGDFDGNGYDDLAVGIRNDSVNGVRAGAVSVLYGSTDGLHAGNATHRHDQLWNQDGGTQNGAFLGDIQETAEAGEHFGVALVAGDFNGDGYADLAIGVPGEDVSGEVDSGAVHVLYGGSSGLVAAGNELWHQDQLGMINVAEAGDGFGIALAAGNFDGDTRTINGVTRPLDDLAVGISNEGVGADGGAGAVAVIYGSASGLDWDDNEYWNQDGGTRNQAGVVVNLGDIVSDAEPGDGFGFALAAGDFDDDHVDDLAIGAPWENVGSVVDAGAVNVLHGTASGLDPDGNQVWTQNGGTGEGGEDLGDLQGASQTGDQFGYALAAGDFDRNTFDDLAIGVPNESVGGFGDAGAVNVLYSFDLGLENAENQVWHQDVAGIDGMVEGFDRFGSALTAGNFNGDLLTDDLAVAVPLEDIFVGGVEVVDAGAVNVLYGAVGEGLDDPDDQVWHQNGGTEDAAPLGDLLDQVESGDGFGSRL